MRAYTRQIEFDFIEWTIDAIRVKYRENALGTADYIQEEERSEVVRQHVQLVADIQRKEAQLSDIYANPELPDPDAAARPVRVELEALYAQRAHLGPLAESILQHQIGTVVAELGLSLGGQPLPPVLYHSTPIPSALIVSPRDVIRQDNNISLMTDLTLDEKIELEDRVESGLNVSSLVVGIGGIGVYPTMVMQSSSLDWVSEVVAHEWVHNYLTLRPLGINYMTSPELRTMNETTASIAGIEIGQRVLERYYPDLLPPPQMPEPTDSTTPAPTPEPPAFNFNVEMRQTRLTVDQLLAEGKIEEAEAYMEERRKLFWENGYHIRKLNQAYFAFYGAYADQPGGAAGEDPVGEAVRGLRAQSDSLAKFLNCIAWMSSFQALQRAVSQQP